MRNASSELKERYEKALEEMERQIIDVLNSGNDMVKKMQQEDDRMERMDIAMEFNNLQAEGTVIVNESVWGVKDIASNMEMMRAEARKAADTAEERAKETVQRETERARQMYKVQLDQKDNAALIKARKTAETELGVHHRAEMMNLEALLAAEKEEHIRATKQVDGLVDELHTTRGEWDKSKKMCDSLTEIISQLKEEIKFHREANDAAYAQEEEKGYERGLAEAVVLSEKAVADDRISQAVATEKTIRSRVTIEVFGLKQAQKKVVEGLEKKAEAAEESEAAALRRIKRAELQLKLLWGTLERGGQAGVQLAAEAKSALQRSKVAGDFPAEEGSEKFEARRRTRDAALTANRGTAAGGGAQGGALRAVANAAGGAGLAGVAAAAAAGGGSAGGGDAEQLGEKKRMASTSSPALNNPNVGGGEGAEGDPPAPDPPKPRAHSSRPTTSHSHHGKAAGEEEGGGGREEQGRAAEAAEAAEATEAAEAAAARAEAESAAYRAEAEAARAAAAARVQDLESQLASEAAARGALEAANREAQEQIAEAESAMSRMEAAAREAGGERAQLAELEEKLHDEAAERHRLEAAVRELNALLETAAKARAAMELEKREAPGSAHHVAQLTSKLEESEGDRAKIAAMFNSVSEELRAERAGRVHAEHAAQAARREVAAHSADRSVFERASGRIHSGRNRAANAPMDAAPPVGGGMSRQPPHQRRMSDEEQINALIDHVHAGATSPGPGGYSPAGRGHVGGQLRPSQPYASYGRTGAGVGVAPTNGLMHTSLSGSRLGGADANGHPLPPPLSTSPDKVPGSATTLRTTNMSEMSRRLPDTAPVGRGSPPPGEGSTGPFPEPAAPETYARGAGASGSSRPLGVNSSSRPLGGAAPHHARYGPRKGYLGTQQPHGSNGGGGAVLFDDEVSGVNSRAAAQALALSRGTALTATTSADNLRPGRSASSSAALAPHGTLAPLVRTASMERMAGGGGEDHGGGVPFPSPGPRGQPRSQSSMATLSELTALTPSGPLYGDRHDRGHRPAGGAVGGELLRRPHGAGLGSLSPTGGRRRSEGDGIGDGTGTGGGGAGLVVSVPSLGPWSEPEAAARRAGGAKSPTRTRPELPRHGPAGWGTGPAQQAGGGGGGGGASGGASMAGVELQGRSAGGGYKPLPRIVVVAPDAGVVPVASGEASAGWASPVSPGPGAEATSAHPAPGQSGVWVLDTGGGVESNGGEGRGGLDVSPTRRVGPGLGPSGANGGHVHSSHGGAHAGGLGEGPTGLMGVFPIKTVNVADPGGSRIPVVAPVAASAV